MNSEDLLTPYALAYFTENGEDGLHLAISRDGYTWKPVAGGRGLFHAGVEGENLMRDPFIVASHDGNGFHCLWTTGWKGRSIGYAHSEDLLNWSGARALPVMESCPGAINAWAPEAVFDPKSGEYLIFFAVTVEGKYDGHRMFFVRTKDFQNISEPEIFYDPGFNVIDAHLVQDKARDRWVMIVKDERIGKKHLYTATANNPLGPWSAPNAVISGELTEGATSLLRKDGWLVLYDAYGAEEYRAFTTGDLTTFTTVDEKLNFEGFSERVRHATAFPIDEEMYAKLEKVE